MNTLHLSLIALWLFASCEISRAEIGSRYNEPYPIAASKKGLQVELTEDALALGIKHAALNLNLTALFTTETNDSALFFEHEGRTYYFRRSYAERMDREILPLSRAGVLVNLIVLTYASGKASTDRVVLHPNYDTNAPNRLGAFNSVSPEGRQWLSASMAFLSERWSRPDQRFGRVVGYIIGNEINSHWYWSNQGAATMQEFARDYHEALRLAHRAIRSQSSWARVYVSLDHFWNMRMSASSVEHAFAGREFLEHLAQLSRTAGDFDWHIAYHPYPEDLFNPAFWNDKSATPRADSPRVTFKNLAVLMDFLKRDEMTFGGKPRRVILSEQGFHTREGDAGETLQASAYCYAFKIVESLDGIDAFILHRHVDHDREGGLLLGLRRNKPANGEKLPKKKIYDCFRLADTSQWAEAFAFALPVVGLKEWNSPKSP